jgi:hypothetical protein
MNANSALSAVRVKLLRVVTIDMERNPADS